MGILFWKNTGNFFCYFNNFIFFVNRCSLQLHASDQHIFIKYILKYYFFFVCQNNICIIYKLFKSYFIKNRFNINLCFFYFQEIFDLKYNFHAISSYHDSSRTNIILQIMIFHYTISELFKYSTSSSIGIRSTSSHLIIIGFITQGRYFLHISSLTNAVPP